MNMDNHLNTDIISLDAIDVSVNRRQKYKDTQVEDEVTVKPDI